MVGCHHPRQGVTEGLAEQHGAASAHVSDYGGHIVCQIMQRNTRHRASGAGDAARLRPQHPPAGLGC